jgi:hypothetical protein
MMRGRAVASMSRTPRLCICAARGLKIRDSPTTAMVNAPAAMTLLRFQSMDQYPSTMK